MSTSWHVPPGAMARFAAAPAALDPVWASSVEAHLAACGECRAALADLADPAELARSWAAVADLVDRPRPSPAERALVRLGFGAASARLLAATPVLRATGLAAVAVFAGGAVVASRHAEANGPFLLLAPLLPLLVTALAFVPSADPAGEAGLAAPVSGAGLVLRRAVVLLGVAFTVLGVAAVALPGGEAAGAAAWVLPALALATGALALGTWLPAEVAATGLGFGWCSALVVLRWRAGRGTSFAEVAVFSPVGQTAALALTLVAVALLVARRQLLGTVEVFR